MNIVCVESLGISRERFEDLKAHYAALGHTFNYYMDRNEDEAALVQRMAGADVVVVSNIRLSAAVLAQCPNLKYLSVAFTGLDHIDLAYCREHGIEVQNAAGYSTTAVSELAVGMMLDLLRNILTLSEQMHQGAGRGTFLGRELRGKTVGIVGTGAIGIATARLLLAFGAKVIAWSRTERPEVKAMGISYMPLDDLLRQSDIVSLHVPLCDETRGLIGERELQLMKPTALLVNTARGPVADIAAVGRALVENRIAGAAFDVFEHEPPLPLDHLLLSTNRCLVTPHVAFATEESFAARADIVFGHVDQWLQQQ
ncbi:MAG: hydroxyacid dehydrogenase [Bacteroidales bacterium]|nr:hydroxyacid dehydrogenase [Bacteroidales bacterium]